MLRWQQKFYSRSNNNNSNATFILTCSFKWNHLMVLYAYHYHPSDRDRVRDSRRPIIVYPARVAIPSATSSSSSSSSSQWQSVNSAWRTYTLTYTYPSTAGWSLVACARSPCWFNQIVRSGKHFYRADVWLAVGAKCFAATHCFNAFVSRTHTYTNTHSSQCCIIFGAIVWGDLFYFPS